MRTNLALSALALAFGSFVPCSAQVPSVLVTPSKVTLTRGEPHTFRAVGTDGHLLRGVRWSLSPIYSAEIQAGDEVEVSSNKATEFEVVADYEGKRATAQVTVIDAYTLPEGATRWSVTELPGFYTKKLTPAVPSPGGPDIFAEEVRGTERVIRAYTEDGRELWRTALSGNLTPEDLAKQNRVSLNKVSACDKVNIGATKKDIAALPGLSDYAANSTLFGRDRWSIEEPGTTCHIQFDPVGKVVRKRKELTDQ